MENNFSFFLNRSLGFLPEKEDRVGYVCIIQVIQEITQVLLSFVLIKNIVF